MDDQEKILQKNEKQCYDLCLDILETKPIFLKGKDLEKYTGINYKYISYAILGSQRKGHVGIINVKGRGYVATKWIYENENIYQAVKRQVKVLESEALYDLKVANFFREQMPSLND